jgi:hypothetical protein
MFFTQSVKGHEMQLFRNWLSGTVRLALQGGGLALVLTAIASFARADFGAPKSSPELDPGSISSALALLSGGVLMLTARRSRD